MRMFRRLNILILVLIALLGCTKLFAMERKSVNPIKILQEWIEEEKKSGAPNPQQAVLSTVSTEVHRVLVLLQLGKSVIIVCYFLLN